jgi:hypothetical protein
MRRCDGPRASLFTPRDVEQKTRRGAFSQHCIPIQSLRAIFLSEIQIVHCAPLST